MAGGSLVGFTKGYISGATIYWKQKCHQYLYEASLGLQFLHERGIVHGDVRLENVLIGSDGIAKLANVTSTEATKTFESDVRDLGRCHHMLCNEIAFDNHEINSLIRDMSSQSPPAIAKAVTRMKRIINAMTSPDQSEQEPSVSIGDIFDTLHNIEDTVRELGVPHYCEIAHVINVMCNKVIAPDQHITQRVHDAAIAVLEDIKSAIGPRNSLSSSAWSISNSQSQIAIQRLSRSCANDGSLDFFYKKMERLLNVFEASSEMYQELATRWADITKRTIELFVSEVDKSLTLLRDVGPDDLITLLHQELQSKKYSSAQHDIIQKAYNDLFTKRSTEMFVSPPEWFIGWYELEDEKEFAHGGFGDVSRAKWLNSDVVVKRMSRWDDHVDRSHRHKEFKHEVNIWFRLNHPHVVKLFGGCHIGTPFFVCEDAKLGQLDSYLKTRSSEVWQKLYEAALGLEYLHARDIVHGDLKCNNILVGSDGQAKLTDFGLSTSASGDENVVATGAIRWSAPECLKGEKATAESDVFSLGMCIIEAVTGAVPWATIELHAAVKCHVLKGKLPERPDETFTDPQWKLVEDMCQFERSRRLKLLMVVQRLKEFAMPPSTHQKKYTALQKLHESLKYQNTVAHGDQKKYTALQKLQKLHECLQYGYQNTVVHGDLMNNNTINCQGMPTNFGLSTFLARDNEKVAAQPPHIMIHSMKEKLVQCKTDASKLVSIQTYELLLERLDDLYAGKYDAELEKAINAKLAAIVSAANGCVAELPKQLPPVEGVKSVFRGFSLHRSIDRVLAEYFISPSSDVHQWKTKCSTMLQSLKAGE